MSINLEEFDFIVGYENLYMINTQGHIYSCYYKKIMTQNITSDGYMYVNLTKPLGVIDNIITHKRTKYKVHRLVAKQYLPNPESKPEVDHMDRNKKNNTIYNLRWVTRKENRANRADIIANKSPKEQETRLESIKEYKRQWAEKDRREKGCLKREEMTKTKEPDYQNNWRRNKKANMTAEEKAEANAIRRANRKPLTEEQKIAARARAQAQRERKLAIII